MPDAKDIIAGSSSFVLGVDGYTQSTDLKEQEYVSGMNLVCRGGIAQTRPGTKTLLCLPDGNLQGMTLFTPQNGVAHQVAAVDGKIYVSAEPFTNYRRLKNIQFSPTSKYVAWCPTLKSTDYNAAGELITLETPYSILMIQDGVTRAAFWDGSTDAHLNPASPPYPNQNDNIIGYNETRIGLWMIWSGNRLWVSNRDQIYASDIGNPLKFTETLYLNEARAFYLSGPCTGMIEVPTDTDGGKGFAAFTENDGTLFNSQIQDRTLWLSTPLFQNTIIRNSGCVAPRSIVTQYGLTWWFSAKGLTNANAALQSNVTSRIDYQDNEMFTSKAYLGPDLSGICAAFYENYLLCSVPSGDVLNRHTWVLDQAPFEDNANAWTGYWTGWRPIEWARGIINGTERIFFASIDYDGKNRIWEAMLEEHTDNGCPITCYMQTREHTDNSLDMKRYDWSKFFLTQMYGTVELNVYVASTKGGFQLQKTFHLEADKGQVYGDVEYSEIGPYIVGNRPQTRLIRTPSGFEDNECNKCGVESIAGNMVDYAFSHLLVWSGQMGIRAYQIWMLESPERQSGECMDDEVSPRTLNDQGCSGLERLVDGEVFEYFEDSAEGMATTANGYLIYIQKTARSPISQRNALSLAECAVQQTINQLQGVEINPECFSGAIMNPPIIPLLPTPPVMISAITKSDDEIDVAWQNQSGGVDGYYLERSLDGVSYAYLATIPFGLTAYQDTGLTPETQYFYRIKAYNAKGESQYSNSVEDTTYPLPLVSASAISQLGTGTLVGFDEMAGYESTPPKKYLTRTFNEALYLCVHAFGDCGQATQTVYGGVKGITAATPGSGSTTLDPATGLYISSQKQWNATYGTYPPSTLCELPAAAEFGDGGFVTEITGEVAVVTGDTVVTTATSRNLTRGGVCGAHSAGDDYNGFSNIALTNEDTEATAIARAVKTAGVLTTAKTESRGAGDFTFDFVTVAYTAACSALQAGVDYILTVTFTEENYGGGGPVVTQQTYPFTASGTTHNEVIALQAASGKQITPSNPTIAFV